MERDYRLFLDGIEFFDIPEQVFLFNKTLIRDSGINNDDQIFRAKTEAEYKFYGDAYKYLLEKRCQSLCTIIEVRIEKKCNGNWVTLINGTITSNLGTHTPAKCMLTTKIDDKSFSALIRERQDTNVFVNNVFSVDNTTEIEACPYYDIYFFKPTNELDPNYNKKIRVFEFFDTFKWMIRYLTNNTVPVVSDYFTTGAGKNKYGITTGAMLRLGINGSVQTNTFQNSFLIPEISFKNLFTEFRKILRLYLSVEYDNSGNNILRIEPEEYFYKNNILLDIPEIPLELEEEMILDEMFSEIKVGADKTDTKSGHYYTPRVRLFAFEEESYNNCTTCVIQNELNLVNSWIIDSNVIFEILKEDTNEWDKEMCIIELDGAVSPAPKKYTETENAIDGVLNNYYNKSLNNISKLVNWIGGMPECIAKFYDQVPCMEALFDTTDDVKVTINVDNNAGHNVAMLVFKDEICDNIFIHNNEYNTQNVNIYDKFSFVGYYPLENNTSGFGSIGSIPFSGKYQFEVEGNFTNILKVAGGNNVGPLEEYKWELKILVFKGGLSEVEGGGDVTPVEYATGVNFEGSGAFEAPHNRTLKVTTPLMTLSAGVIVMPVFRVKTKKAGMNVEEGDAVQVNSGYFKMLYAEYDFNEDLPIITQSPKLVTMNFKKDICCNDYLDIEKNRYGIIRIAGNDTYVKEIKYNDDRVSEITVIADKFLC